MSERSALDPETSSGWRCGGRAAGCSSIDLDLLKPRFSPHTLRLDHTPLPALTRPAERVFCRWRCAHAAFAL